MRLIFDASSQSFDAWWQAVFPAAALILTIIAFLRGARPLWKWTATVLTIFLLFAAILFPVMDANHVKAALASGSVKTVTGPISMHKRETTKRWAGDSRGVGIASTRRYTSTTSEQFFVGRQWFWLRVNGYSSNASFTNSGDPPLPLRDGTMAKVTWFEDPWYDNETRIVRLELRPDPAPSNRPGSVGTTGTVAREASATVAASADFQIFWKRFSGAAANGEEASVAALTRFPFLFSGTQLDRDRFDSIWMGLFPQPLRSCFATAVPVKDGDAWSVACGVYVYIFENDASEWRFASFAADPEAE